MKDRKIVLKEFAEEVIRVRESLGISSYELARRLDVTKDCVYQWQNANNFTNDEKIKKLEEFGAHFSDDVKNYPTRKRLVFNSSSWEYIFDKLFTHKYNPNNAQGYDGDAWKIIKGEPIKPSKIKDFIKRYIVKEVDK